MNVWAIGDLGKLVETLEGSPNIRVIKIAEDKIGPDTKPPEAKPDLILICSEWRPEVERLIPAAKKNKIWLDRSYQEKSSVELFWRFSKKNSVLGGCFTFESLDPKWLKYSATHYLSENHTSFTSWVPPQSKIFNSRFTKLDEVGTRVDFLYRTTCALRNVKSTDTAMLGWFSILPAAAQLALQEAMATSAGIKPVLPLNASPLASGQWVVGIEIPISLEKGTSKRILESLLLDSTFDYLTHTCNLVSLTFGVATLELTIVFDPSSFSYGRKENLIIQSTEGDAKASVQDMAKQFKNYEYCVFPEFITKEENKPQSNKLFTAHQVLRDAFQKIAAVPHATIDTVLQDSAFKNDEIFVKFLKSPPNDEKNASKQLTMAQKIMSDIQVITNDSTRMAIAELVMRYLDLVLRHKKAAATLAAEAEKFESSSKLKKIKKAA